MVKGDGGCVMMVGLGLVQLWSRVPTVTQDGLAMVDEVKQGSSRFVVSSIDVSS